MELLVTIIKDYRKVEDLLLGFVERDVTGATVLEGRGMGQLLGDVPIMADLRGLFPGSAHNSYVVIAAMTSEKARDCIRLVEETCGPLDQAGSGVVFTMPIGNMRGLTKSIL